MKKILFAIFLISAIATSASLSLEFLGHLTPCPLCMVQRFAFMACLVLSVLALGQRPRKFGRIVYAFLIELSVIAGLIAAIRQILLQHFLITVNQSCGASMSYLFRALPWQKALTLVFLGSGDCAEISGSVGGITLAQFSCIGLFILAGLGVLLAAEKT